MVRMLRKIIHQIMDGIKLMLGIILLATLVLLFINVTLRYVFGHPIVWAEELIGFALVWIVFIGAVVVTWEKGHIVVGTLKTVLPKAVYIWTERLIALVSCVICLIVASVCWELVMKTVVTGQLSTAARIPMYFILLALPFSYLCMAIGFAQECYQLFFGKYHYNKTDRLTKM